MSRVAVIGIDRKGRRAVLAVGIYRGSWSISAGALSNDERIVCKVTSRGQTEAVGFFDCGQVVVACRIDPVMQIDRSTASVEFPAGALRMCLDGAALRSVVSTEAAASIEAMA